MKNPLKFNIFPHKKPQSMNLNIFQKIKTDIIIPLDYIIVLIIIHIILFSINLQQNL